MENRIEIGEAKRVFILHAATNGLIRPLCGGNPTRQGSEADVVEVKPDGLQTGQSYRRDKNDH